MVPTPDVVDTGPAKVTLLLGADTLSRIDAAMTTGHFGSRGRTIDAVFEALWDCQPQMKRFEKNVASIAKGEKSSEEQENTMIAMTMQAMMIFTRLGKFFEEQGGRK